MEPTWIESQQQLQRQNTETHVSQRMGFYRGTAGRKAGKVRIRSWDVGMLRETLRALKQRVKLKSFRQDAKRRNNSSVSSNLEINHTLEKIFLKGKLFSIIFF